MNEPDFQETAGRYIDAHQELHFRRFSGSERILKILAGTEEKRFVIGRLLLPLFLAFVATTFGTILANQVQSSHQDWQDRKARARDVVDEVRKAASELEVNMNTLEQAAGSIERIRAGQSPLLHFRAVRNTLTRIEGLLWALENTYVGDSAEYQQIRIRASLETCKDALETYVVEFPKSYRDKERKRGSPSTDRFAANRTKAGSCDELVKSAYSLLF